MIYLVKKVASNFPGSWNIIEKRRSKQQAKAMWRDKVVQRFLTIGKQKEAWWHGNQKLVTTSFVWVAMIVTISTKQAVAFSVVSADGRSAPTSSKLIVQLPTLPSTTLPPTVFPTNQTPAVSVPPLQSTSSQTPTPDITFQAPTSIPGSVSPTFSPSVIEFGQPLPRTAPESPRRTLERTIPTLEPGGAN